MTPDQQRRKTLVWICGPPAVGKMTVGRELSEITGFPLFHNHLSIEAVLPVFEFGSPPFNRIVAQLRDSMFLEAAESELPGLIYTMVWAFDHPGDVRFVKKQKEVFEAHGGRAVFVELVADLDTRLARNASEPRVSSKPSKRDVEASRRNLLDVDGGYRLDSQGAFPFSEYLRIDNTHVPPRAAAEQIAGHFGLVQPLTSPSDSWRGSVRLPDKTVWLSRWPSGPGSLALHLATPAEQLGRVAESRVVKQPLESTGRCGCGAFTRVTWTREALSPSGGKDSSPEQCCAGRHVATDDTPSSSASGTTRLQYWPSTPTSQRLQMKLRPADTVLTAPGLDLDAPSHPSP